MNITSGTLARTIILALALVNQLLSASGHAILPIDDTQVETIVSTVWTVIAALVTWWRNQSFTAPAIAGDEIKQAIKSGDISAESVEELLK